MKIISGRLNQAVKVVLYGTEGIGKTTFAGRFPAPIFIDTEGGSIRYDVTRFEVPETWNEILQMVSYIVDNDVPYKTLVLDTADKAEMLCLEHICKRESKSGLEAFGYGKGYTYLAEEFGNLIALLNKVIKKGINVVVTAHAYMRKFEQPDEMGAYDRWELKLGKKTSPLLKEWADMDVDDLKTIEQSHFIRAYNTVKKREEEYAMLPQRMRDLISTTVKEMPMIPDKEEAPVETEHQNEIPEDITNQIEALRAEFRRKI